MLLIHVPGAVAHLALLSRSRLSPGEGGEESVEIVLVHGCSRASLVSDPATANRPPAIAAQLYHSETRSYCGEPL
jgi:hypothetical protein